ncbi:hypothetical protein Patl1_03705 [Pistacia atlantica]|uniref:Uncharacterized protein n=1 Tax=Pistacia atlantica TaxID=434234 RepID=A0ACC1BQW5_9ROSI|nr:hypothetical protein Patl1_03705 [Pistacia atlantica]
MDSPPVSTTPPRAKTLDKVYALFLCRLVFTPTACQECVSFATSDILKRCPVQKKCTPDLSDFDCNSCLEQSFSSLPTTHAGARVLLPSCCSHFELYPFFNENVPAAPPPMPVLSSPPPVFVTRPKGKVELIPP